MVTDVMLPADFLNQSFCIQSYHSFTFVAFATVGNTRNKGTVEISEQESVPGKVFAVTTATRLDSANASRCNHGRIANNRKWHIECLKQFS